MKPGPRYLKTDAITPGNVPSLPARSTRKGVLFGASLYLLELCEIMLSKGLAELRIVKSTEVLGKMDLHFQQMVRGPERFLGGCPWK